MTDARDLVAAPSATVGPFFHFGLTTDTRLGRLARGDAPGEHLTLTVSVLDGDGTPVPDAVIEVWQVDADGRAVAPPPEGRCDGDPPPCTGFGRLPTLGDGSCVFHTVRPGRVPDGRGGRQAAHINVCLFARGLLRHLHTRIYFAGDPALGEDAVLALVPEERRPTLLAEPDPAAPDRWTFVVRLQGHLETVFFDV